MQIPDQLPRPDSEQIASELSPYPPSDVDAPFTANEHEPEFGRTRRFLAHGSERRPFHRKLFAALRRHPIISGAVALGLLLILHQLFWPAPPSYEYVTAPVVRGAIESGVSASGKVRALNTIKVGSEVSGQVTEVLVGYNASVKRGQVLAIIDPTRFRARVHQVEAQVLAAKAELAKAEAALARARIDVGVQRRELDRRRALRARGFSSEANLDAGQSHYATAIADSRNAEAQEQSARAQIAQGLAELSGARLDLRRTTIASPATGVVIDKLVEPGATVAASFQTPNLFEIASDLTRMQVEASIDEADIGRVKEGQPVRFTVDAYPGRTFWARVRQIRQSAIEAQNVVTYLAILEVDNRDRALLPGMTANVSIITGRRANSVRVPTSALLFRPRNKEQSSESGAAKASVWVATADPYKPQRRDVRLGLQGEDFVEILDGLKAGEQVLVRTRSLKNAPNQEAREDQR